MKTLKNGENGIILLEGEATISGQIIARKKALKSCLENNAKHEIVETTLNGWIDSHEKTIKILEELN